MSWCPKCKVEYHNTNNNYHKPTLEILSVSFGPRLAKDGDVYIVSAVGPWKLSVQKIKPNLSEKVSLGFKSIFNTRV